jgi:hypothetical protein
MSTEQIRSRLRKLEAMAAPRLALPRKVQLIAEPPGEADEEVWVAYRRERAALAASGCVVITLVPLMPLRSEPVVEAHPEESAASIKGRSPTLARNRWSLSTEQDDD